MKRIAGCIAVALTSGLVSFGAVAGQGIDGKWNQVPLRFVDANGKVVGRAAWTSEEGVPSVVMQEAKQVFAMRLYNGGQDTTQFNFSSAQIFFEGADCSGQAYVAADYMIVGLRIASVVLPPDGRTLICVGSGRRAYVHIMSTQDADSSCRAYDVSQFRGDPLDTVIDVTGKFKAPFTIR